jgi:hypothetical protein
MQSTTEWAASDLTFEVFAHQPTKREYYEDDGHTFDYRQDGFFRRTISVEPSASGVNVTLSKAEGKYVPAHRLNAVVLHFAKRPRSTTLNGGAVGARYDAQSEQLAIGIPQSSERLSIQVNW